MKFRCLNLLFLVLLAALSARAEVLTVGPEEQFKTVGEAVRFAAAGDTIRVQTGIYLENLIIEKTLTIEGVGMPTIQGTGKGSVIEIRAANCTIRGLGIETSGGNLVEEDAGILLMSSGNTIEDNRLSDILFGIYLYQSADNKIRRNRINGRTELESGERGGGLHLWNSPRNLLEDNIVEAARDGMYIQSSSGNVFRGNRIYNLRYGLHFMNSDDNSFEDNVFFDNIAGAAIMYSQRIALRRNAFVHNRGFSSFGILFQDCRNCITEENLILDNAVGIFMEAAKDSVFRRNTIAENDVAMQIFASSDQNTFTQNNFINNISPLQLIGKGSSTTWQDASGGNYWGDYEGYDLDADGLGDVPHRIHNIFEYLEGNFPRLRIYLNSPAAQSIVVAERSFPILKGSNEFDRLPLMSPVKIGTGFVPPMGSGGAKWMLIAVSAAMLGFAALSFKRGLKR